MADQLATRGDAVQDRTDQTTQAWRTVEDVERATARWVDGFNHRRLYEYCGLTGRT
jgi:putative transposase